MEKQKRNAPSGTLTKRVKRSKCGIANALDLIGDKWTLLVMRDALFFQCRTFADFSNQPEHIPTNLLSERLAHWKKLHTKASPSVLNMYQQNSATQ